MTRKNIFKKGDPKPVYQGVRREQSGKTKVN
jgi:hypothetical protein